MMKCTLDRDLWRAIEAFEIDSRGEDGKGPELAFEVRLAREQGWSREFAARVVGEYRRFVYLAMEAGHAVSPSPAVDEAWHLHLLYTRSYWERMCGEVLKRPLHHEPTRGGVQEGVKFEGWYGRTLESYRDAFGEEAPADVWPRAKGVGRGEKRVGNGGREVGGWWDQRAEQPKDPKRRLGWIWAGGMSLGAVGSMAAAAGKRTDPWTVLVLIAVLIAVMCLAIAWGRAQGKRGSRGSGCGGAGDGMWMMGGAADAGQPGDGGSGAHTGHHGSHHGGDQSGHHGGHTDSGGHGDGGATGSHGCGGGHGCGSSGCGGGGGH